MLLANEPPSQVDHRFLQHLTLAVARSKRRLPNRGSSIAAWSVSTPEGVSANLAAHSKRARTKKLLCDESAIADRTAIWPFLRRLCSNPVVASTSNIELVTGAAKNRRLVHNVASRAKNPTAIPDPIGSLLAVFGQDDSWFSNIDVWPRLAYPNP